MSFYTSFRIDATEISTPVKIPCPGCLSFPNDIVIASRGGQKPATDPKPSHPIEKASKRSGSYGFLGQEIRDAVRDRVNTVGLGWGKFFPLVSEPTEEATLKGQNLLI